MELFKSKLYKYKIGILKIHLVFLIYHKKYLDLQTQLLVYYY